MQKRMFNIKEKKPDNTDFFLFEDYFFPVQVIHDHIFHAIR